MSTCFQKPSAADIGDRWSATYTLLYAGSALECAPRATVDSSCTSAVLPATTIISGICTEAMQLMFSKAVQTQAYSKCNLTMFTVQAVTLMQKASQQARNQFAAAVFTHL